MNTEVKTVAEYIRVTGTVQGVGFRPTVWRLAREYHLLGAVWNDAEGVVIQAWGAPAALDSFVARLRQAPPPLARITDVRRTAFTGLAPPDAFTILASRDGRTVTDIVPDAATCPACLADVNDPHNRRYRYPFTNCTHCGPRLSIIAAVPYDRANTSMAPFIMCEACQREYDDPADRRFHAQPNACGTCGPQLWLEDAGGVRLDHAGKDAIGQTADLIRQGFIVAVKGLGGIHLACDARDAAVVDRLRRRKRRYHKPFALMARDAAMVRVHAGLDDQERVLLESPAAPVVVLDAGRSSGIAPGVAPGQTSLGFMLPYTPLHHLLLAELDAPIVLTSGNRSDEPQCITNQQARQRLGEIADFLLLHDRDILNRLDDSVLRKVGASTRILRRARGYAPAPLALPTGFEKSPALLAMGGELKNTFCLLQDGRAIVSQHMGDLEDAATQRDYRHNLELFARLFDHEPGAVAVDLHPGYLSTQLGRELAAGRGLTLCEVQHHHAHIASCMAEHGLPAESAKVLGITLDGLGLGADGALWGGEFLLADYRGFQRLATFQAIAMPGAAQAMRQPWRNSYAHLRRALGWPEVRDTYRQLDIVRLLAAKPLATLDAMLERGVNSPLASSAGRLFDAVAAVLGLHAEEASFEGQPAMALECLAEADFASQRGNAYTVDLRQENGLTVVIWRTMWRMLLQDLQLGTSPSVVAARFHWSLVDVLVKVTRQLARQHAFDTLVLSGGVLQNRLLSRAAGELLRARGFTVLAPQRMPANDGGLSLGQAVIAASQLLASESG